MNKYLKILEFDRIISRVQSFATLDATKRALEHLELSEDWESVTKMLSEVDEATILIQRMGRFPIYFQAPIDEILKKIHKGGTIVPEELVAVGLFLDTVKANHLYWEKLENNNISAPYYEQHLESWLYVKDLNLRIKQIVNPYGEIQDDASPAMKSIRRQARDIDKRIQQKLQELLVKESSKLTQAVISMRNDRYVIPVKNDYKNAIRGIIHDQSASRETVFIEPLVVNELTNALKELALQEQEEVARLMREMSLAIDEYHDDFMKTYEDIVQMDVTFSKADYALTLHATKPELSKDGVMKLVGCYHPLLNVSNIVKNNIEIGSSYQGIIITGPNTGGKTVLLKTIGLLSLMVKAGMLLPCSESSLIPLYSGIYADIGDEQSIHQNLSTFSSHLTNVTQIIHHADRHSLVLLDELGSGTDPIEGAALAISIFDALIAKKCHVVATSHYSELKLHAYRTDHIINASVEFDEETLQPTYKLLIGVPGMSNALKIAKRLGLPSDILEAARDYSFKKSDDINRILEQLVHESHELELKLKEASALIATYQANLATLEQEKRTFQANQDKLMLQANQKAKKLIEQSMMEVNELLDELKSKKNQNVKLHEIADLTHRIRSLEDQTIESGMMDEDHELAIQDQVFLKKYQCYGVIQKVLPSNKFEVLVGNASMKVDRSDVVYAQVVAEPTERVKTSTTVVGVKGRASSTLDLRGKRYEEASVLIERMIDDAVYANFNQISIIHGFGTGVIRKLVHEMLKQSPHISEFRFGGANEGGQGITIATIKK